jgi:steroid delta-isomerase-like uncharacterized protein
MMSSANKALLVKWFEEVWNHGRTEAIDGMMAPDAVVHGLSPTPQGPEQFKTFHRTFRDAFPDIAVGVDDLVAEGDLVAARWSATATHRGNGLGFAATNRPVQFTGMVFARIENGKLVEGWNSFDQLGMMAQLGMVMRSE